MLFLNGHVTAHIKQREIILQFFSVSRLFPPVDVDTPNVVQELFEQNEISEEEMRTHYRKNIVTLAIAAYLAKEIEIYSAEVTVCKGDIFFVCSDGVWEALPSNEIASLLTWDEPLSEVARRLFETLMNVKCKDNISFIICRVDD